MLARMHRVKLVLIVPSTEGAYVPQQSCGSVDLTNDEKLRVRFAL